jgi:hypothetical protein
MGMTTTNNLTRRIGSALLAAGVAGGVWASGATSALAPTGAETTQSTGSSTSYVAMPTSSTTTPQTTMIRWSATFSSGSHIAIGTPCYTGSVAPATATMWIIGGFGPTGRACR